ncbi:MAG: hypothetical protein ACKVHE_05700 [Planctomycetales bacterium]|jgi:hypothetical protein
MADPFDYQHEYVDWQHRLGEVVQWLTDHKRRGGAKHDDEYNVFKSGYGSTGEWRSALEFLSRLTLALKQA